MVDSFRTVVRKALNNASEVELQGFVQRLALHLTSWQATTFLIGEYVEGELRDNPVFTVADGLFWLYQSVERNSIVRKMQVMKLRGQESVPGLHTFRITGDGLQTFPRTFALSGKSDHIKGLRRLSTGVRELDAMLGGGIPEGDSLLLAGPSDSPIINQPTSRAGGVFPPASANSTRSWAAAFPKATACSWPVPPEGVKPSSAFNISPRA